MTSSKRSPIRRAALARDLQKVVAFVGQRPSTASELVEAVDFPAFVAGLIAGVFQATVTASIEQMNAYAALVRDVARSVDAFRSDNVSADRAHGRLNEKYGPLLEPPQPRPRKRARSRAARTRERQRLVASIALMGINRIVVTDGKINTK